MSEVLAGIDVGDVDFDDGDDVSDGGDGIAECHGGVAEPAGIDDDAPGRQLVVERLVDIVDEGALVVGLEPLEVGVGHSGLHLSSDGIEAACAVYFGLSLSQQVEVGTVDYEYHLTLTLRVGGRVLLRRSIASMTE